MKIEKTLSMTITVDKHGVVVCLYEGESGDVAKIHCGHDCVGLEDHLVPEVASWVALMVDELEEGEKEEIS